MKIYWGHNQNEEIWSNDFPFPLSISLLKLSYICPWFNPFLEKLGFTINLLWSRLQQWFLKINDFCKIFTLNSYNICYDLALAKVQWIRYWKSIKYSRQFQRLSNRSSCCDMNLKFPSKESSLVVWCCADSLIGSILTLAALRCWLLDR